MKFFYLAHGVMSLRCLEGLIEKNCLPGFVAIHLELEKDKLNDSFYEPIQSLCENNKIALYKVSSLGEISHEIATCEAGISVGFMEIIKKNILDLPKFGIINLHCGKLPNYRGRAPISRSIINNEEFLTMTLHKMDEGVDSGDVLTELEIPIKLKDDVNSLYIECSERSPDLIIKGLNKLDSGEFEFVKQDLSRFTKANTKLKESERRINWNDSVMNIYNLVRAIVPPYPGAITRFGENDYLVTNAEIYTEPALPSEKHGEIIANTGDSFLVSCKDGILKISEMLDGSGQLASNLIFQKGNSFE